MLAVTAAMVVPSIQISGGSLDDEVNRLRLVLRLVADETQLRGSPLRVEFKKDEYSIEAWQQGKGDGEWFELSAAPLTLYYLPDGIEIVAVEQAMNYQSSTFELNDAVDAEKGGVLATLLFLPDGTTSQVNIRFANATLEQVLEVGPGPQGIRLKPKNGAY